MKYLSKITLGLILCTGLVTSCKDDDETGIPGGIAVDKEEITIAAEGGIEKIAVSSHASWVASASKPWIAVSPANGLGSAECSLAIDSTLENTARTAQIRFALDGGEPKLITITQFGYGKQILLKEPEMEIENSAAYNERYLDAVISTNINFKIDKIDYSFAEEESMTAEEKTEMEAERSNWLTMPKDKDLEVNLDRKARPRTIKVRFRWGMNTAPFTRVAKIRLVPVKPAEDQLVDDEGNNIDAVILTVNQKPAVKIEDNRAGDSLAIITINKKIRSMSEFNTSENMQNWKYATLWEATDKLPEPEAVGRVRSLQLMMFNLEDKETLPKEIRHLKYLESFTIQSNENRQIRDVALGEEICELKHLKNLTVWAYGLTKLPENFSNLGNSLEQLNLASNNFAKLSDITDVVNEQNFPKLTSLDLSGCRRTDSFLNLQEAESGSMHNGKPIGLHVNIKSDQKEKDAFLKLLVWDNLRKLEFSFNYIEGSLPTDAEVKTALSTAGKPIYYQDADFFTKDELEAKPALYLDKLSNDTCQWLKTNDNEVTFKELSGSTIVKNGQNVLRVLPKVRKFAINLNFLTGPLPSWVLFHPYYAEWYPESMIFNQQEKGTNSEGKAVLFDNIDPVKFDYTYYYGDKDPGGTTVTGVAYPLYYRRYVANGSN